MLGIKDIDVVVADVNDQESIEAMCAKTRVVVNVVGPVGGLKLDWFRNKKCLYDHSISDMVRLWLSRVSRSTAIMLILPESNT